MDLSEFLNSLKPAQATLISSIVSALVALLVVGLNRLQARRSEKRERYDAVKRYANPIIHACEQLAWRLKEILEFHGIYFLPNAPKNDFFQYKIDSTSYRLCAVLGWIHAAKKEESYIQGLKFQHHEAIQSGIEAFQMTLADGSHVEISIIDDLTHLYNLKKVELSEYERGLIGVELEKIVFSYIPNNVKREVSNLQEEDQIKMVKQVLDHLCSKTNQSELDITVIKERIATAIKEIAREYCWIYRDLQSAIGELMVKPIEGASRRFDVIGFPDFREMHKENDWLQKADGLFTSLDVSIDDRFDSRVQQTKKLYGNTVDLIVVFKKLVRRQETIPEGRLLKLIKFKSRLIEIPTTANNR